MKNYDKEIADAVKELGVIAFIAAKENCPVRTGRLKNSIAFTMQNGTAVIGTDVSYAPHVELGHGRTAPRSFLGKGAVKASENVIGAVISNIRKGT